MTFTDSSSGGVVCVCVSVANEERRQYFCLSKISTDWSALSDVIYLAK